MRARSVRSSLVVVGSLGALVVASRARGDDKQTCIHASDAAQEQRAAGKLIAARESLLLCTREVCPAPVRQFCDGWLREVEAALPSVILRVHDASGHDLVEVRVSIDGRLVAETLDGRPIAVDPGVHVFRIEAKGAPAFEEKLVVVESEKNRLVIETLPTPTPLVASPIDTPARDTRRAGIPVGTWVLGAIGVVAIGSFATFSFVGSRAYSDCIDQPCSSSKRDSIELDRVLAWTSLGVGVAALGGAAAIYFGGRSSEGSGVALRVEGGVASVAWMGRF